MQDTQNTLETAAATWTSGPQRRLYEALFQHEPADDALEGARASLETALARARELPCDLPAEPGAIEAWMAARHEAVGRQYLDYLQARRAGAPRRYFSGKAHALYFLRGVAPTKMVDGSWLYGLVHHWADDRFHPLIRTYLEELGDGVAADNHVVMYRKLLAANGCEHWRDQDDARYEQGAIQLSLAHQAAHFLPEVIGFNLGYEQLPLHLLITAYELNELGIDPYYFTVHVTVDNAGTGHARKAVEAVLAGLPAAGGADAFYARVRDGYRLNDLGLGTEAVIRSFDAEAEVVRILKAKSVHGRHAHSDYCRIGGRTVNEWLTDADDVPGFLKALQDAGWIRRHAAPAESRFWKLIEGDHAEMFGVFSPYEVQVIHDWIAGDALQGVAGGASGEGLPRRLSFRAARRLHGRLVPGGERPAHAATAPLDADSDFDAELRLLQQGVERAPSRQQAMTLLADMIGPATHHTPAGLLATRLYARMLAAG